MWNDFGFDTEELYYRNVEGLVDGMGQTKNCYYIRFRVAKSLLGGGQGRWIGYNPGHPHRRPLLHVLTTIVQQCHLNLKPVVFVRKLNLKFFNFFS